MAEESFAEVVRRAYLSRVSFRVREAERNMREGLAMAPPSLETRFKVIVGELEDLLKRVEEMKREGH